MGWASGSEIAEELWDVVREYIPEDSRKSVASRVVSIFEDRDCDTIEEAELLYSDADPVVYCFGCDQPHQRSELDEDYECEECRNRHNEL